MQVVLLSLPEKNRCHCRRPGQSRVELAGVRDVLTKNLGSSNALAMVSATMAGLRNLRRFDEVARLRGKNVEELVK